MIYFIGIKGTGMSALACILYDLKMEVAGSDLSKHFFTEEPLRDRGIPIYEFSKDNIKDGMTVIIGNAFKEDFEEVIAARSNPTVTCYRYHEYLGEFMKNYVALSVAGSHGKTTTTGMLETMMSYSRPTGYLIGDGTGAVHNDSEYLCVESCEYRRHFLAYHPQYAIITNADIDHVDYFKDEADYRLAYEQFSAQVEKACVVFGDDPECRKLKLSGTYYFYGTEDNDDIQAINIVETSEDMQFDVLFKGENIGHFHLPFVGRHLLWNALGVISIGHLLGIDSKAIETGLSQFKGVKRRFVIEKDGENVFIDDYAHHPTEVGITIDAARRRFPDKKLVVIFKPHRVSRVFRFADAFANNLKKADRIYLCDFTSIDDKEDGIDIDIRYLQERIDGSVILSEDEKGAEMLAAQAPACFLFMSSKDIYGLAKIVKDKIKKAE